MQCKSGLGVVAVVLRPVESVNTNLERWIISPKVVVSAAAENAASSEYRMDFS